jgi:cell division protein FtsB
VPEAKRPDPKRRSPAGRPKGTTPARRQPRATETRSVPEGEPNQPNQPNQAEQPSETKEAKESVRESIAASAAQQSEQRFGSAARRAAILAAVVCVLTLTIAGPVRTYFSQRTEMKQLKATEAQLRTQIADLEEQKVKLADPVFIAAQARERLGFVMPGDIPYQVQLPANAAPPGAPGGGSATKNAEGPWYTSLWHTIADAPHGVSPATGSDAPSPGPPPPAPPAPGPPAAGG